MIPIIILLIISQIACFYLIFTHIKVKVIKPEGFVLKSIPKSVEYSDIDPEFKLVYEVIETIKLEKWWVDIDSPRDTTYLIKFESNDNSIFINSRIYCYDDDIRLSNFSISKSGKVIHISDFSTQIENVIVKNDILLFLWDYVIGWYEEKNNKQREKYNTSIDSIRKSLKTLNRSKKLNDILNG